MKTENSGTFFLLLVLTVLLSGSALFAQNSKKEEIRIPSAALKPFHNEAFFSDEVKKFKTWLESLELPPSLEEFQKKPSDFEPLISNEFQTRLTYLRSVALHPDLEEVTRISRNWYGRLYNAALPIQKVSHTLNNMTESGNEQRYQAVKKILDDAKAEALAILKKPQKLSREELEVIAAKNRERRRKEYIKWYRAKQAQDLKKAREKAAGKKKSDKQKNTPGETE